VIGINSIDAAQMSGPPANGQIFSFPCYFPCSLKITGKYQGNRIPCSEAFWGLFSLFSVSSRGISGESQSPPDAGGEACGLALNATHRHSPADMF
jgi:hypothetical protein